MSARCICELAQWEADAWRKDGRQPNCREHLHVSRTEACEKTCFGDFRPYNKPIASWVGKHHNHIVLQADRVWRRVLSDGFVAMQLVPGTSLPQSKPQPPVEYVHRGIPALRNRQPMRRARRLVFSA